MISVSDDKIHKDDGSTACKTLLKQETDKRSYFNSTLGALSVIIVFPILIYVLNLGSQISGTHIPQLNAIMEIRCEVTCGQYKFQQDSHATRIHLENASEYAGALINSGSFSRTQTDETGNRHLHSLFAELRQSLSQLSDLVASYSIESNSDRSTQLENTIHSKFNESINLASCIDNDLYQLITAKTGQFNMIKYISFGSCLISFAFIIFIITRQENSHLKDRQSLSSIGRQITREIQKRHVSENHIRKAYQQILDVCDELDTHVYITRIDTHEMLYTNLATRKTLGNPAGKVCWQYLQRGQSKPCAFCIKRRLLDNEISTNSTQIQEHKDSVTGQWMQRIDQVIKWHDGETVHLGIQFNISHRKLAEAQRTEYLRRLQILTAKLTKSEESQKKSLAQALHDGLGQDLFALKTLVGTMDTSDYSAKTNRTLLDGMNAIISNAIKTTRDLTTTLYPPVLSQAGLYPALNALALDFSSTYKIDFTVHEYGQRIDLPEHKSLIFSAVRELMINAAKHAKAGSVIVNLIWNANKLLIEVTDDGSGNCELELHTSSGTGQGFGIFSIRERLRDINGSLAIRSKSGIGTTARLRIPLNCIIGKEKGERHEYKSLTG